MDRDGDPLLRDAKLVFAEQSARGGHRSLEDVRQAWKLAIGVSTTARRPTIKCPSLLLLPAPHPIAIADSTRERVARRGAVQRGAARRELSCSSAAASS